MGVWSNVALVIPLVRSMTVVCSCVVVMVAGLWAVVIPIMIMLQKVAR